MSDMMGKTEEDIGTSVAVDMEDAAGSDTNGKEVSVTREMKTSELLAKYPEARELFFESGMFCAGCQCAEAETVEQALAVHCMDIDAVIDYLNEKIGSRIIKKAKH